MIDKIKQFEIERDDRIKKNGKDEKLKLLADKWVEESMMKNYVYNFSWLGRPIIQCPQDILALQEIIWDVKPDIIIETGIAHGGSLIMSASMLAMLDICEAIDSEKNFNPKESKRKVLGIDIDIRKHNREAIEKHPMFSWIQMIEGSSISPQIIKQVEEEAKNYKKILVCLDSNHTHEHVLAELKAYAPLTSVGSYCVVFDTIVEDMPKDSFTNRPWNKGNNPKTALKEYLKNHPEFEIDRSIFDKLLITSAPEGYLKKIF